MTRSNNSEKVGTLVLFLATLLVAASIMVGGDLGRMLNGAAGLTWFAAAGLLALAAFRDRQDPGIWIVVVVLTGTVAFFIKPTDFAPAIIGFGLAGAIMATLVGNRDVLWAKLVVGLYLPLHIGTAIGKALYRSLTDEDASIRSDPPPTAAVIPLVMLIAAIAGAVLVQVIRKRRVQGILAST